MIQINSLKLPCGHSKEELEEKYISSLKISRSHLKSWKILRQSIDARKSQNFSLSILSRQRWTMNGQL